MDIENFIDPKAAAESVGLHYNSDDGPGITRRRQGKGFAYFGPDGKCLRDAKRIERIRKLAIPPAWTAVWISPDANGHLAATGRDARGRKQYRYNPQFSEVRHAAKYEHLIAFAKQLPRLRKQVASHMALQGLPREKVLATIVYLLERTRSRIGNESYAKDNNSYGLTTLRNRHVQVQGTELKFLFTGKSGKTWRFGIQSKRVAKIIRACQELPGQHLFEYRDDDGSVRRIGSSDVNDYLREIVASDVTAKDFRTWAGTVEAALALHAFAADGRKPTKADIRAGIERAAECLGNTVAICRKCYVHPAVISSYEAGGFALTLPARATKPHKRHALSPEEKAVLRFLEAQSGKSSG